MMLACVGSAHCNHCHVLPGLAQSTDTTSETACSNGRNTKHAEKWAAFDLSPQTEAHKSPVGGEQT